MFLNLSGSIIFYSFFSFSELKHSCTLKVFDELWIHSWLIWIIPLQFNGKTENISQSGSVFYFVLFGFAFPQKFANSKMNRLWSLNFGCNKNQIQNAQLLLSVEICGINIKINIHAYYGAVRNSMKWFNMCCGASNQIASIDSSTLSIHCGEKDKKTTHAHTHQ